MLERMLELVERELAPRSRWSSAPGSTEPGAVAIGTPSSGEKPIVVSTERPSRTAVTEQPPPRWQTTSRGTRDPLRRPLHREPVEAEAADPPLLAPAPRKRVVAASGGSVAWKAVSKTATCGTPGSAARAA